MSKRIRFGMACLMPLLTMGVAGAASAANKPEPVALTARVVTVHRDAHFSLTPNAAKTPIKIDIPNTVGMWEDTMPVEIALVKGKNTLSFTRQTVHNGLAIKDFTLKPLK